MTDYLPLNSQVPGIIHRGSTPAMRGDESGHGLKPSPHPQPNHCTHTRGEEERARTMTTLDSLTVRGAQIGVQPRADLGELRCAALLCSVTEDRDTDAERGLNK
jgi:hypothetical protein